MIQLEIQGVPVPLARPRLSRHGVFDSQAKIKEGYQWQMKGQFRESLISTPLSLHLFFYMPIPATTSGIKKKQMLAGMIFHDKRPDVDNLIKFVLDCMNKIIFTDDSQIVDIHAKKIYSTQPATVIQITKLGALEGYATS